MSSLALRKKTAESIRDKQVFPFVNLGTLLTDSDEGPTVVIVFAKKVLSEK